MPRYYRAKPWDMTTTFLFVIVFASIRNFRGNIQISDQEASEIFPFSTINEGQAFLRVAHQEGIRWLG